MSDNSDNAPDLILASASPRRAALLHQLEVSFSIVPAEVDESAIPTESPSEYVRRLALHKAETVSAQGGRSIPVLAADTVVVVDNVILGKPRGIDDAKDMFERLSGRWHEVYSGVAVMQREASVISVRTRVKFRDLVSDELERYWTSGEPQDKAGAYAIQGLGGAFVERIDGSYSNVVGLPLVETLTLLDKYHVRQFFKPIIRPPST